MLNSAKRSYDSQRGNKLTFGSFVDWTVLSEKTRIVRLLEEIRHVCSQFWI